MFPYVEQSAAGLRQNLSAIDEAQFVFLPRSRRLRQDHRDQVVPSPRQLRPFHGWVVNELDRLPVHGYAFHLQESRQFKQQCSGTLMPDLDLQSGLRMNLFRGRHFARNGKVTNGNGIFARTFRDSGLRQSRTARQGAGCGQRE